MNKKGFTLIEILISMTILITAFVVPITIIADGISQTTKTSDRFKAQLYAEDGIEKIREMRDTNFLERASGKADAKNWWKGLCNNPEDNTDTSPYNTGSGDKEEEIDDSIFDRTILIKCPSVTDRGVTTIRDYIFVYSKVEWTEIDGTEVNIEIKETLYNWLKVLYE